MLPRPKLVLAALAAVVALELLGVVRLQSDARCARRMWGRLRSGEVREQRAAARGASWADAHAVRAYGPLDLGGVSAPPRSGDVLLALGTPAARELARDVRAGLVRGVVVAGVSAAVRAAASGPALRLQGGGGGSSSYRHGALQPSDAIDLLPAGVAALVLPRELGGVCETRGGGAVWALGLPRRD